MIGRDGASESMSTVAPPRLGGGHPRRLPTERRDHGRRWRIRPTAAVAATVVLALAGGGVAYAWFTSGGTGAGSAIVGSGPSDAFVISASAPEGPLLPGNGPQAFDLHVANTTGRDAGVATVSISLATSGNDLATGTGADIAGCLASWFGVTPSVTFGAVVPAHSTITASGRALTLPAITMSDAGVDQDACQGASIGVNFSTGP